MPVPLELDSLQGAVRVDLMGGAQLMVANDLGIGDLFPPGLAQQMLGLDGGVTQEVHVRNHGHVVFRRHVIPLSQSDLPVVHGKGRGDDASKSIPVLPWVNMVFPLAGTGR